MKKLIVITRAVELKPKHGKYRYTQNDLMIMWRGKLIKLLAPYCYNGASVPWPAQWYIYRWAKWLWLPTAWHDYGYDVKTMTRKEWDLIFLHLMWWEAEQSRFKFVELWKKKQARIAYRAVRKFGAIAAGGDW